MISNLMVKDNPRVVHCENVSKIKNIQTMKSIEKAEVLIHL